MPPLTFVADINMWRPSHINRLFSLFIFYSQGIGIKLTLNLLKRLSLFAVVARYHLRLKGTKFWRKPQSFLHFSEVANHSLKSASNFFGQVETLHVHDFGVSSMVVGISQTSPTEDKPDPYPSCSDPRVALRPNWNLQLDINAVLSHSSWTWCAEDNGCRTSLVWYARTNPVVVNGERASESYTYAMKNGWVLPPRTKIRQKPNMVGVLQVTLVYKRQQGDEGVRDIRLSTLHSPR